MIVAELSTALMSARVFDFEIGFVCSVITFSLLSSSVLPNYHLYHPTRAHDPSGSPEEEM